MPKPLWGLAHIGPLVQSTSGRLRREDYNPRLHGVTMATAKTGSFYLTDTATFSPADAANTRKQATIDLGAYVNVPTGQAIAIESVDFIYQSFTDYGGSVNGMLAANGCISAQLTDLNPGLALVRADDQSLVASAQLNIDVGNNVGTHTSDLYPDNYGPASLSEAFMVVNDTLYLTIGNDNAAIGAGAVYVTARIRCRVVKLSKQDWMAIAIQSTASDN